MATGLTQHTVLLSKLRAQRIEHRGGWDGGRESKGYSPLLRTAV